MARERYTIDHAETVANILAWWDSADDTARMEGAAWYPCALETAREMAAATGVPLESVSVAISHLSPQNPWDSNVVAAWELLKDDTRAPGTLHASFDRARKSLSETEPLESFGKDAHKTRAFARAILGDESAVVVDTWALRVALRTPETYGFRDGTLGDLQALLKRAGVYAQIADAYTAAAAARGVSACTMQATTWGVIRGGFA